MNDHHKRHAAGGLRRTILLASAASAALIGAAKAQDDGADDGAGDQRSVVMDEIIVYATGSRLPADIASVPGSVTLVSFEDLQLQSAVSTDLGQILAFSVPGLAPSAKDGNNFAQTLRGRKPAFFIDGLPQSIALRNGGRDLRIVHPFALERVEVIRGSTAIYGLGGSGGVINYITRQPGEEGIELFTEIGLSTSLTQVDADDLEYVLAQGISGKTGAFDFVGSVSYQKRGLFYDADGDPIPPDPFGQTGIADMGELSLFGKVGVALAPTIRWETTAIHYSGNVDTDFTVGQGSFAGGVKSTAVPKQQNNIVAGPFAFDFVGDTDPENHNTLISSSLIFADVLGSSVKLQGFYQESGLIWRHLDFLPFGLGGFGPDGSQLTTDAEKHGVRLDIQTPVAFDRVDGFVLWGVDYLIDKVQEGLVDGRTRTSQLKQDSLSLFAQLQADITDRLTIRGGVRYDDFELDVPDYRSLDIFDPTGTLTHPVIGAALDYDNIAGNVGATVHITDRIGLFASWSQGFSIGDVVRTLRNLRPAVPTPEPVTFVIEDLGLAIEPLDVTSYEAGLRYASDRFSGSVVGFYTTSDLGASFDSITFETVRAPERIWGIEAVGDARLAEGLRAGGSFAWMDSKVDEGNDGDFDGPLDFARVPPPLLTFYGEYDVTSDWTVRLQGTTVFDESRFEEPFGNFQRDIEGYTLFDLVVSGTVLGGQVTLAVENVLNNDYIPIGTLSACPSPVGAGAIIDVFCNVRASGARASVRYSIRY